MTRRAWALRGPTGARATGPASPRLRVENMAAGQPGATIYLYEEIGWWGVTAADFVAVLQQVGSVPITLHINSPGGDVYDALAIYNLLRAHPAEVTTVVDGIAASAASYIMQAGTTRRIARNADVMIHDALGFCMGNAADMREWADELDRVSDNIADIYAHRTGTDVAEWRTRMVAETWFSGREAVTVGLADELLEGDEDAPEARTDDEGAAPVAKRVMPVPVEPPASRVVAHAPAGPDDPDRQTDDERPSRTDEDVSVLDLFGHWTEPEDPWGDFLSGLTSTTDSERTAS